MFEFDIVTLIVAVVLSLAFAAPFYYNYRRNKALRVQRAELLSKTALEKGLVISQSETWRDRYVIGLDSKRRKVLYIHHQDEAIITEIDLSKVKSIELHERSHEVGSGKEKRKVTDHLELAFFFKNQDENITLEFYDAEKFSDMEGEFPLIRYWQNLLKSHVSVNSQEPVLA